MNTANVVPLSVHKAVASRKNTPRPFPNPVLVRFDAFELDEANARLSRDGAAVTLAPKPFGLLCALARRPGSLLTKNELLDDVWGHQFVSESVLKTAISDVRTVLDDHPRDPRFIETVSRRGYRFIASIAAIPAARSAVSVHGMGFSGQPPVLNIGCRTQPRSRATEDGHCNDKRAVACPFIRIDDTSRFETDCARPNPTFATTAEACFAHELRLQLRVRLLRDAAPAVRAWSVVTD